MIVNINDGRLSDKIRSSTEGPSKALVGLENYSVFVRQGALIPLLRSKLEEVSENECVFVFNCLIDGNKRKCGGVD